ncbi:hypothetical protein KAJ83_17750 [Marivibrio halodurans]|uniref:Guanylate cyclase domain-containing protein n=1 Tax=Marivibrio halodurans TaxID=2039722 RepID=A0A8J7S5H5_9PROT|nr:adenylate/guanylate cyclase domain-containing protein [Marivibrio halodurans]MBP5858868.1 hypothetical protein [Marivibrio halodurans]
MARSVSFEVYYMQNGRWQIHARFEAADRDDAIEEAKRLDSGAFSAACVVREAFDSATNTASESVIYHTPTMKAKPPVSFITSGAVDSGKMAGGKSRGPALAAPAGSAAANAADDARKRIDAAKKKRAERLDRQKRGARSAQKRGGRDQPLASVPARRAKRQDVDLPRLTLWIALAFMAACLVGTAVGVLAFHGLRWLASTGVSLERTFSQTVLIGSWVIGWAFTFFPMLRKALDDSRPGTPGEDALEPLAPESAKPAKKPPGRKDAATASLAAEAEALRGMEEEEPSAAHEEDEPDEPGDPREALDALARDVLDALEAERRSHGEDAPLIEEGEDMPAPSSVGAAEEAVTTMPDRTEPSDLDKNTNLPPNSATDRPSEPPAENAPPSTPRPGHPAEEGAAAVKAGLSRLVREAQGLYGRTLIQDSYLRFGLILFLAGAAETFARRSGVTQRQLVEMLAAEIERLGASKQHARGFAANIDEYLLDQRYFDMYAAGRSGGLRISKGTNEDSGLERAVETWRRPAEARQTTRQERGGAQPESKHFDTDPRRKARGDDTPLGFVAVLFTDIVDSTNLQQRNGDKWMMNVVRAHNDIVREALTRFRGQEIKHTGDGIMASFPDVVAAAEGALAMQDGFARFSEMMPDLAFTVRVGLSAGEPIHESGDIFGTPVNLAARVMSKAGAGQIAVSGIVEEMCRDQAMKFVELGRFQLKGFQKPQPIFRLTRPRRRPRDPTAGKRATAVVR